MGLEAIEDLLGVTWVPGFWTNDCSTIKKRPTILGEDTHQLEKKKFKVLRASKGKEHTVVLVKLFSGKSLNLERVRSNGQRSTFGPTLTRSNRHFGEQ